MVASTAPVSDMHLIREWEERIEIETEAVRSREEMDNKRRVKMTNNDLIFCCCGNVCEIVGGVHKIIDPVGC